MLKIEHNKIISNSQFSHDSIDIVSFNLKEAIRCYNILKNLDNPMMRHTNFPQKREMNMLFFPRLKTCLNLPRLSYIK